MKKIPIDKAINNLISDLENGLLKISKNIGEKTRIELNKIVETVKRSLPNEPAIAFLVSYNNLDKFYNFVENAEQEGCPVHIAADILSDYMRLGATINDKCRGYKTRTFLSYEPSLKDRIAGLVRSPVDYFKGMINSYSATKR